MSRRPTGCAFHPVRTRFVLGIEDAGGAGREDLAFERIIGRDASAVGMVGVVQGYVSVAIVESSWGSAFEGLSRAFGWAFSSGC